ncbi:MAG: methylphosphotriester-DNA--protein-cysteine methyltransferase family protein, partial [candidate division Zixibacteria bacterium]|nr:methylphosphotriester-DNA--protein-cysteine methyltransferase family protein [candidate division Zixibacteria bacterium]
MQLNLTENQMYKALVEKDEAFEGIFIAAVKTTGIFCRPTCRARKPKKHNVEYFRTANEALLRGYRPCKVCTPMSLKGKAPEWVGKVLNEVNQSNSHRLSDQEIRDFGVDPNRLRRWFKQNHGMTFQAYLRSLRLGTAFGHLTSGKKVISTAFDSGYDSLSGFNDAFRRCLGQAPTALTDP